MNFHNKIDNNFFFKVYYVKITWLFFLSKVCFTLKFERTKDVTIAYCTTGLNSIFSGDFPTFTLPVQLPPFNFYLEPKLRLKLLCPAFFMFGLLFIQLLFLQLNLHNVVEYWIFRVTNYCTTWICPWICSFNSSSRFLFNMTSLFFCCLSCLT